MYCASFYPFGLPSAHPCPALRRLLRSWYEATARFSSAAFQPTTCSPKVSYPYYGSRPPKRSVGVAYEFPSASRVTKLIPPPPELLSITWCVGLTVKSEKARRQHGTIIWCRGAFVR